MDIGVISVRYARAFLKSALEKSLEDQVYQEMKLLSESYIQVPDLKFTIDNSMLHKDQKLSLLETACGGQCTELTKRFFKLVLDGGRENILQFIATSYISLYRQNKNIISGKLITATTVSPEVEERMKRLVESKTQGTVEFQTETNPDIIGGFVLEYDAYRMDASVQTKLKAILKQLKK